MSKSELNEYYEIKDKCREGLIKYLFEGLTVIAKIQHPQILDIGCGTGVPTITLADYFGGKIIAVDSNQDSLNRLKMKVLKNQLVDRIELINDSFLNLYFEDRTFDIILAEGILHIVGFETGLKKINKLLDKNGYVIIHDEYQSDSIKKDLIKKYNFSLLKSFLLTEDIWWKLYYEPLYKSIKALKNKELRTLFSQDLNEIEMFRQDSKQFRSIYYVIRKQ